MAKLSNSLNVLFLSVFIMFLGVFLLSIVRADVNSYLDLTINEEHFDPGQSLVVKVYAYNLDLKDDILLKILDSEGNLVLQKFVSPGVSVQYDFATNDSAGDWEISASYDNISARRIISVGEKKDLKIWLDGDVLAIKNIGNIKYQDNLFITFVNDKYEKEIKTVRLSLAENQQIEFKLEAKNGVYDVTAGSNRFNNVPLTGEVTSAIKLEKKPGFILQYPVTAFVIFVILIFLIIFLTSNLGGIPSRYDTGYVEIRKPREKEEKIINAPINPEIMQNNQENLNISEKPAIPIKNKFEKNLSNFSAYPAKKAEHSLVLHGQKQGTTIIIVNIKNLPDLKGKLEKTAFNSLLDYFRERTVNEIESNRGILKSIHEASLMGMFSSATKQFRHEIAGVKAALNIRNALENYNKKLKDKIEYGIGINTGELIVSIEDVMKYTSMGNTITLAKKLSEMAKNDVYAADATYQRVTPEVNGAKVNNLNTINGMIDVYSLKSVGGREVYSSYLNDVLKRINKK